MKPQHLAFASRIHPIDPNLALSALEALAEGIGPKVFRARLLAAYYATRPGRRHKGS